MRKLPLASITCILFTTLKLGLPECHAEYNDIPIGNFFKRISDIFPIGIQKQIKIVLPKIGTPLLTRNFDRKNGIYKSLFSNFYVSTSEFDKARAGDGNNMSSLTIIPFSLDAFDLCELTEKHINNHPHNFYLINMQDSESSKDLLRKCDLNYDTNLQVFYVTNSSTIFMDEIYKIMRNSPDLEQNRLVKYKYLNDNISYLASKEKWKRRNDLKGVSFDGYLIPLKPYVMHQHLQTRTETISVNKFSGLFIDVIDLLSTSLNFTVTKNLSPENNYNEIVKKVSSKTTDMAIGSFSITYDRSLHVDFSLGFIEVKNSLFFPKTEVKINWLAYIRPFYSESWFAVFAQIGISALIVCLISLVNTDFASSDRLLTTISKSLVFSTFSAIAKRSPVEPKHAACRVAFFTISLMGFILISLYRAMLGASLAITKEHKPIGSINDVLQSEYRIGTMAGTASESYFTKAGEESYLYEISQKKLILRQAEATSFEEDEFEKMFFDFLENQTNILIFFQDDYPSQHPELICRLSKIDEEYMVVGTGFVFQKQWPFTKLMNHYILQMIEDGRIERLKKRWLPNRILCKPDDLKPSNVLDIFTLCIMLSIGGIIAAVAFLIELWTSKCCKC